MWPELVSGPGVPDVRKPCPGSLTKPRAAVAVPAYVTRAIPFYDFLDEEQPVRIEDQAGWLIQENGRPARAYTRGVCSRVNRVLSS
jgi:hypothetical protein